MIGSDAARIREVLAECADDLESFVETHYDHGVKDHPAMAAKYERDMAPVIAARTLLRALTSGAEAGTSHTLGSGAPAADAGEVERLPEELVRRCYQHFMHGAEHPCGPSAMREAINIALAALAQTGETNG